MLINVPFSTDKINALVYSLQAAIKEESIRLTNVRDTVLRENEIIKEMSDENLHCINSDGRFWLVRQDGDLKRRIFSDEIDAIKKHCIRTPAKPEGK